MQGSRFAVRKAGEVDEDAITPAAFEAVPKREEYSLDVARRSAATVPGLASYLVRTPERRRMARTAASATVVVGDVLKIRKRLAALTKLARISPLVPVEEQDALRGDSLALVVDGAVEGGAPPPVLIVASDDELHGGWRRRWCWRQW